MGINPIQPIQSPLLNLLNAANSTVGIVKGLREAHTAAQTSDLQDKLSDPDSAESQMARADANAAVSFMKRNNFVDNKTSSVLSNHINGVSDDKTQTTPSPMSAAGVKQVYDSSPLFGLAKAQMAAQAMAAKTGTFTDRNSIGVGKDYESTLKPYRMVNEDVARVESALSTKDKNGNPLITSQQLGDANAAIARIFSPNHMSDATVSRTEYESLPAKFKAAIQKYSANPQDIGSRDLINHIIDQAHHIANTTNQNALQELDSLDAGNEALSNPGTKAVAKSKSDFLRKRFSKVYPTIGEGGQQQQGSAGGSIPGTHVSMDDINAEIQRRAAGKKGP